jgi:signal transduction histidine kinase
MPSTLAGVFALPDSLPKLIALACHDLRTPLATVRGFARTLEGRGELEEPSLGWVRLIEQASIEMAELIDQLSLAARIEAGEYDPVRQPVSTEVMARQAVRTLAGRIALSGRGEAVLVDEKAAVRALAGLGRCLLRHGELERARLELRGPVLVFAPVGAATAAVMLGEDLRDLRAAIGVRVVRALGGEAVHTGGELEVRLPAA